MVGTEANSDAPSVTVIKPTRGWRGVDFVELWRYRELLYFLVWRDLKVRYKQTLLGAAWAILQPLIAVAIFSVFFGLWAGLPTEGIPGPLFYFAGILPWQLFQGGVNKAGISLVASRNLITKVYFPRLAVPTAPVFANLVDFALAFLVLIVLLIIYGVAPTTAILALPLFLLLDILVTLGIGLWLASLNVMYRDIGQIIPFLLQVWFFLTPVVYSSSIVPERFQVLYGLNPLVGIVEGFRWALLDTPKPSTIIMVEAIIVTLVLLITGVFYFRRMERTFADIV
ncbi:MAG: ABC transporter permease [Anaerolineales bacterium]|nr:ABC transporter permease [Anaerolineales bacterium]